MRNSSDLSLSLCFFSRSACSFVCSRSRSRSDRDDTAAAAVAGGGDGMDTTPVIERVESDGMTTDRLCPDAPTAEVGSGTGGVITVCCGGGGAAGAADRDRWRDDAVVFTATECERRRLPPTTDGVG